MPDITPMQLQRYLQPGSKVWTKRAGDGYEFACPFVLLWQCEPTVKITGVRSGHLRYSYHHDGCGLPGKRDLQISVRKLVPGEAAFLDVPLL